MFFSYSFFFKKKVKLFKHFDQQNNVMNQFVLLLIISSKSGNYCHCYSNFMNFHFNFDFQVDSSESQQALISVLQSNEAD